MEKEAEHILAYIVQRFEKIGTVTHSSVELVNLPSFESTNQEVIDIRINVEIKDTPYGVYRRVRINEFNRFAELIVREIIIDAIVQIWQQDTQSNPYKPLTTPST